MDSCVAVQAIGETTRLIRYHNLATNNQFYARRKEFLNKTDIKEHQQLERLVVIKEACGNGYLALVLSALLLTLDVLVMDGVHAIIEGGGSHWYQLVFVVGLIAFLARMHFIHVKRQTEYMDSILNASDSGGEKKLSN